ncbi:hypothetical protein UMZ34_00575 [Halopseudomonas pachastrellae]|nr:hypothetical protein UMZ34_00575 [Halopseudomonas pachastrellae]
MYSLAHAVTSSLEIRKSRFLACVEPIADRAAAQARVDALRAEHPLRACVLGAIGGWS